MIETDIALPGGRVLHVHDAGGDALPVVWHHGTPNIGTPPAPLAGPAAELGLRWIGYDRPGYGGSTPVPGRSLASAAADVRALADALGLDRVALAGHSGGASHALAVAAAMPDRVTAVLAVAALAPRDAAGLDWYAGMSPAGRTALLAAEEGFDTRVALVDDDEDPGFVASDLEALRGEWGWFGSVVGPALAGGPGGAAADDVAYVRPWGADPEDVRAPVLLLHGSADRIAPVGHARWLAGAVPGARLTVVDGAGHISVLRSAAGALGFLADPATPG